MQRNAPSFTAHYFDGRSTQAHSVSVTFEQESNSSSSIWLTGENIKTSFPLQEVTFSERTKNGPRRLSFKNSAFIEALDPAEFDTFRHQIGRHDSLVVRLQQNWRYTLLALFMIIAALVSGYQWGLPWFARLAAPHVPAEVERFIGEQGLDFLERSKLVQASRLSLQRQMELRTAFDNAIKRAFPDGNVSGYRIEFRSSVLGPNAFALPGGIIIVTDAITQLLKDDNDEGLLGVLGHELGHLHHKHTTQHIITSSVIGTAMVLLIGDASTLAATTGTAVLHANYSRQAETEADTFALEFMKKAGIPPTRMADMFKALQAAHEKAEKNKEETDESVLIDYFSTHPPTPERIRLFEQG